MTKQMNRSPEYSVRIHFEACVDWRKFSHIPSGTDRNLESFLSLSS